VEQPFILMSRAPAVHARALHSPGDLPEWNCGSCVWGEVLCEVGQRQTPEVWRLECFLDHDPQRHWHIVRQRFRIAVNNRTHDVEIGGSSEGASTGQRFIQHDTEREDVASGIERLSERLLWRHVRSGSDNDSLPRPQIGPRGRVVGGGRFFLELGQPEVGQFGVAAGGEQDVLGLHVAVEDAGVMGRGQRIREAGQ